MKSYTRTQSIKWPWIIYDCGLSRDNIKRINDLYNDIEFKDINYNLYEGIQFYKSNREWFHNESRKGVYNAAYRFDIFLEEGPEWLFYIDSDVIFAKDVSKVFDLRDNRRKQIMDECDVIAGPRSFDRFEELRKSGGIETRNGSMQYINAGIMAIRNTVRTIDTHRRLVHMCRTRRYEGNQQPLNEIVIGMKWKLSLLSPWYNMQTEMWRDDLLKHGDENFHDCIKILHLTGAKDPDAYSSRENFYKSLGRHYNDNKKICAEVYTKYISPLTLGQELDVVC